MKTYIIGMGPGAEEQWTTAAKEAIAGAKLIIGSKRLIEQIDTSAKTCALIKSEDIISKLKESATDACVLMSGDIGFYSGAKRLMEADLPGEVIALPGISSPIFFAAKLGISWQDFRLVSAHGRDCDVIGNVKSYEKVFFLTGGDKKVRDIIDDLIQYGFEDATVHIGEELSLPTEKIHTGLAKDFHGKDFASLSVMLVEHTRKKRKLPKDDEFIRTKVPMTKEEIRALIVGKLNGVPERVIYDVGSGTGSVSVALALEYPLSKVYAVEKKKEAYELSIQNKEKFKCHNLFIEHGLAADVLKDFPAPDSVFIGGSSGQMRDVLEIIKEKNEQADIVITAVTLETLNESIEVLEDLGYSFEIKQIGVTDIRNVGRYKMLFAKNPIFIIEVTHG